MRKVAVLVVALLAACVTANAQSLDSKLDVFVGYSFLNQQSAANFPGTSGNHGYDVRLTYNVMGPLGIEADFSGNHGSSVPFDTSSTRPAGASSAAQSTTNSSTLNQDTITFLFGPKLSHAVGNFRIYTHFLAGGAHVHEGYTTDMTATGPITFLAVSGGLTSTTAVLTQSSVTSNAGRGTGFGFEAGGGVDWTRGRWGLKILEANYLQTSANFAFSGTQITTCSSSTAGACTATPPSTNAGTNATTTHDFRLATGVIFRFGIR